MKVVINKCYGGFSVSEAVYSYMGLEWDGYGYALNKDRTNPELVEAVEMLGGKANGEHAKLKVVEIPDDAEWEIDEYDGLESISEVHRVWG